MRKSQIENDFDILLSIAFWLEYVILQSQIQHKELNCRKKSEATFE